jgi:hypothetical protein
LIAIILFSVAKQSRYLDYKNLSLVRSESFRPSFGKLCRLFFSRGVMSKELANIDVGAAQYPRSTTNCLLLLIIVFTRLSKKFLT